MNHAHDAMADLFGVGPGKPLGYLPLATICAGGWDIHVLTAVLADRGLKTVVMPEGRSMVGSGALYACDERALGALLARRVDVLRQAGWPVTVDGFIATVDSCMAERWTALFDLIADAYGDKNNPGRRDRLRDLFPRYSL